MDSYKTQQEHLDKLSNLHKEWMKNMSHDEKRLFDLIHEYEEKYFCDFTFEKGSVVTPYLKCDFMYDNEWVEEYAEPSHQLSSLTLACYRFMVEDVKMRDGSEAAGQANLKDRIITIPHKYIEDKTVVLHEMIHGYEGILNNVKKVYREILIICLYKDLRPKIKDLDSRLEKNSQLHFGDITRIQGGEHDLLFCLKSLDLDLRCNYKLGTVCGYGSDKY